MHHFNETETQWTDRGPWAFYLSYHISIFLFINYTITSIKYDSRNIIIPQYQYITNDPLYAAVFSTSFIVRLIAAHDHQITSG